MSRNETDLKVQGLQTRMSSKDGLRASKVEHQKDKLKDAHIKRKGAKPLLKLVGNTVRNENDSMLEPMLEHSLLKQSQELFKNG